MSDFEVFRRDAQPLEVSTKLRQIDVLAAPYNQETDVPWNGEIWHERYMPSAFKGFDPHAGRTSVNREHRIGDTIGKVLRADTGNPDGMVMTVQIAKTLRGDEALALAEEEMLGASLGYYVKRSSDVVLDRKTMRRDVMRAFVDHLALVEQPAYKGARVLAVREQDGLPAIIETPLYDEFLADPIFRWARELKPRG